MADRGATPVVGKVLEVGIVLLYVSLLTAALYGTVVPEYRATAGQQVADRTVATAAERVQQAVPPRAVGSRTTVGVDLPATIAGAAYRIRVEDRTLVLDHPGGLSARSRLALPDRVVSVRGTWASGDDAAVQVRTTDEGLAVALEP